jgi:mono/diheme cytochrome c family protein
MGHRNPTLLLSAICVVIGISFAQSPPAKKSTKAAPKGDVARGKKVFLNHCEQCHDPYSKDEDVGPGLEGIKDGKLPDGKPATREILLDLINTGPAEMPSFKDRLTEAEKEDVIAFVMSL